ncbi:MAG: DUF971 domain-containing protein [Parachlamydiaceae bacterium]|nr:DUF971 domain-containing protein [Parachlamydiaceae bacterium]
MKTENSSITAIKQTDNHSFQINWNDGTQNQYRLSDLQKNCPCAGCVDELTGQRIATSKAVDEDVRAISIQSVGRYALKIKYTSGCSTGIYSYSFLKRGI